MSQPLRQENSSRVSLITTRTQQSRIWFEPDKQVHNEILGCLAKVQQRYGVQLFAFALMNNHYHKTARYPAMKRASACRDFNSAVQRVVKNSIPEFNRGTLWERRYAEQALPTDSDVEEYFWYCVFQEVAAGFRDHISPKSFFFDAINGVERVYYVLDRSAYYRARRRSPSVNRKLFMKPYTLRFSRLPGYEQLSQADYRDRMLEEYERRRKQVLLERARRGKATARMPKFKAGELPSKTKTSSRNTHRPLVLTHDPEIRRDFLALYFSVKKLYRLASDRFFAGEQDVEFPPNTYLPSMCLVSSW